MGATKRQSGFKAFSQIDSSRRRRMRSVDATANAGLLINNQYYMRLLYRTCSRDRRALRRATETRTVRRSNARRSARSIEADMSNETRKKIDLINKKYTINGERCNWFVQINESLNTISARYGI